MLFTSARARYLLLVSTLLPLLYILLFKMYMFSLLDSLKQGQEPQMQHMMLLFGVHFMVMGLVLLNMVLYGIHAAKNPALTDNERIVWLVLLIFLPILSHVVYWFMCVNRRPTVAV